MLETNSVYLSVNGAVDANGLRLGSRGPGCIRLLESPARSQELVKDRPERLGPPSVPQEQLDARILLRRGFCRTVAAKAGCVGASGVTEPRRSRLPSCGDVFCCVGVPQRMPSLTGRWVVSIFNFYEDWCYDHLRACLFVGMCVHFA